MAEAPRHVARLDHRGHRRSIWASLSVVDVVLRLHGVLANALVLYLLILGVWGVAAGLRGRGPSSSYIGALLIVEAAVVIQGVFGIINFLQSPPRDSVHVLYGFALALALPFATTYARGRPSGRISLFMGVAALFCAGLAFRGILTS